MHSTRSYNDNLLSYLSRKLRHEQNKTLVTAAFGKVSKSTIHNLETQEKAISLLTIHEHFENLGVAKAVLGEQLAALGEEVDQTAFQLKLVKMMIDGDNPTQGLADLAANPLPSYHPLYSYQTYLHARSHFHQENWTEASKLFAEAVRQYEKSGYRLEHQLVADCYNLLGLCAYRMGNLEEAVQHTQEARLHHPQSNIKCSAVSNLILYLSYLGNTVQAMQMIDEYWGEINQTDKISTRLNVYLAKTTLLKDARMLDQAIACAQEGLDLALLNHEYNRAFELLNVLGNIYLELSEWNMAENCCKMIVSSGEANNRRQFDARLNLSALAAHQGDLEAAKEQLEIANTLADKSKTIDLVQRADLKIMYGEILKEQKDYERALTYYNSIIEQARKANRKDILKDALSRSLDSLLALNRMDDFNACYQEVHSMTRQPGGVYHAIPSWRGRR